MGGLLIEECVFPKAHGARGKGLGRGRLGVSVVRAVRAVCDNAGGQTDNPGCMAK